MQTPAQATEDLVARVRASARGEAPHELKTALMQVLGELEVRPGDPAWTDGTDVIGSAYERLVTGRSRRPLGQFFTPLRLARVMARWALAAEPDLLLDPGCGPGSLLIAASQLRTTQTRLLGLDLDPLAIRMATKNKALRAIPRLDLRLLDFLEDDVGVRPQAIACNPPYTRHQALPAARKEAIHRSLNKALGVRFSHLASLHVLFLVRALEVAADEARVAFVTPAHWLDMGYAREVKRLLLGCAHVEAIMSFPADEPVFDHALTTASLTLIRKGAEGEGRTRIIRAPSSSADDLSEQLADPAAGELVTLTSTAKWSRAGNRKTAKQTAGPRLDTVATVRRGAATGHNEFFVLSERQRRQLGIDRSSVRPCLASPRYVASSTVTTKTLEALPLDVPRWLLTPKRPRAAGPLANYLRTGTEELRVRERHLVKQREKAGRRWYEVEADFEAPILFTYFNRTGARFVRNCADAVPLNTWLTIRPQPGVDVTELFKLLTDPGMAERLQDDCRIYGNGLWKLEPSELAGLMLPRSPMRV